jgi:hypothetical protein
MRYPSESDNRFNIFTHLTAGYTGLLYWTYDHYYSTGSGLIDSNGNPTALYHSAAQAHAEVVNLGESLRFLTSTDVRFIRGKQSVAGGGSVFNSVPLGLTNWSAGAGGDTHILSLSVDLASPANLGPEKNGLIGFFTDDDDDRYFMLTNLNHGAGLSADAATLPFTSH